MRLKNLKTLGKVAILCAMVAVLLTGWALLPATTSSGEMNALEDKSDTVTLTREEYERLEKYASLDELTQMVEQYYYVEPDMDAMLQGT